MILAQKNSKVTLEYEPIPIQYALQFCKHFPEKCENMSEFQATK